MRRTFSETSPRHLASQRVFPTAGFANAYIAHGERLVSFQKPLKSIWLRKHEADYKSNDRPLHVPQGGFVR